MTPDFSSFSFSRFNFSSLSCSVGSVFWSSYSSNSNNIVHHTSSHTYTYSLDQTFARGLAPCPPTILYNCSFIRLVLSPPPPPKLGNTNEVEINNNNDNDHEIGSNPLLGRRMVSTYQTHRHALSRSPPDEPRQIGLPPIPRQRDALLPCLVRTRRRIRSCR